MFALQEAAENRPRDTAHCQDGAERGLRAQPRQPQTQPDWQVCPESQRQTGTTESQCTRLTIGER